MFFCYWCDHEPTETREELERLPCVLRCGDDDALHVILIAVHDIAEWHPEHFST